MREIKFRAWIPDIQRIYQAMSIDVEPQNGRQKYVTVWEHPCVKSAIIKGKVGKFRLSDGVELMQFTGLTDKNGVEVYEGDVIEWKDEGIKFEVEWSQEDCGFICIRESCAGSMNQQYLDHFEIIGNIHENKELLDQGG